MTSVIEFNRVLHALLRRECGTNDAIVDSHWLFLQCDADFPRGELTGWARVPRSADAPRATSLALGESPAN